VVHRRRERALAARHGEDRHEARRGRRLRAPEASRRSLAERARPVSGAARDVGRGGGRAMTDLLDAGLPLWPLALKRAELTPDALFAVDERERRLSFAQYRDAALRVAAGLHARGVREGTVVSWQLPTRIDALVLAAALSRLGAVQNPVLPFLR